MPRDLDGLRLLLVGDWPPPLGGVSVHVRSLRDAAARAGMKVTVLDIGRGRHEADGVVPADSEVNFIVSLATLASMHDVVHLHTSGANAKSWALILATGAVAKTLAARPVLTLHSGHGPRWLTNAPRTLAARVALAQYERLICVSDEIALTLSRLGIYGRRGLVAPAFGRDGLEPGALPAELVRFRRTHTLVVAAMLGAGEDYGATELLAAFPLLRKQVPGAALVVYGPGSTDAALGQQVAKVKFPLLRLGEIERGQALAVMKASDLFVRPTRVDGDAVSVREALAMGTAVVATRIGTRPAGVTLCDPASPKDLARAMRLALASPPLRGDPGDGISQVLTVYAEQRGAPSRGVSWGGRR